MQEKVNVAEAKAEFLTLALLFAVMGAALLGNVTNSLIMLLAGLVLLGSAVYQNRQGWHVGILTWVLGVVFTLGGLGLRMFLVTVLEINFVGLTLVVLAVYLAMRWLRR